MLTRKLVFAAVVVWLLPVAFGHPGSRAEDHVEYLDLPGEVGKAGGTLFISQRSQPSTLNPLVADDSDSQSIISLLHSDLIHVNRYTQQTEPALASSWSTSPDRRRYTLHLRKGVRFSDGAPFDADDVVFTFKCYLDEAIHSPQRDLLMVAGQPISVQKEDSYTVTFSLAQPYAAAERLFDGISILPKHLLERAYDQRSLGTVWGLDTPPAEMAGLGPFRLKEYLPGQRITLERNSNYWKRDSKGQTLPYLESIVTTFVGNSDAEAMRFAAGEFDVLGQLNAAAFAALQNENKGGQLRMWDLGPGFEFTFLMFNQNALQPVDFPSIADRQQWFRDVRFRQAVSSAIDREALIRLAYRGRAFPLQTPVTPGNKWWFDKQIPPPSRSLDRAHQLLRSAGFSSDRKGLLRDERGKPVTFSLAVNAGKSEQIQAATLIQQDLKDVGIDMKVELLDFHTLLERVFTSFKYQAALLGLADGDADPNSEVPVLTSTGATHVWSLKPERVQPEWQSEVDRLMKEQLMVSQYPERKRIYDRVQELIWQNCPAIFLVSPDILVAGKERVGNFRPALLRSYTLWNAEQLYLKQ